MRFFILIILTTFLNGHNIKHLERQFIEHKKIERHTKNFINKHYENKVDINDYKNINIPIIFHVIYNDDDQYNLDYQIDDMKFPGPRLSVNKKYLKDKIINQLNNDFNAKNNDLVNTPKVWEDLIGDFKINFFIKDIKYINSYKNNWGYDDDKMKFTKYGGSDVIDPELNLNVWIVNINPEWDGSTILGYAQFPGNFYNKRETDGFVLNVRSFLYPNDRTSTHEIGHWMNLRHIWGDGGCNDDDFVLDTPLSDNNHIDCHGDCSYPETSSCGSPDMFMNFMSYGDQTYMFTKGQMVRSRAIFAKGGIRHSMITQNKDDVPNEHDVEDFVIIISVFILFIFYILFITIRNKYIRNKTNINNIHLEKTEDEYVDINNVDMNDVMKVVIK